MSFSQEISKLYISAEESKTERILHFDFWIENNRLRTLARSLNLSDLDIILASYASPENVVSNNKNLTKN